MRRLPHLALHRSFSASAVAPAAASSRVRGTRDLFAADVRARDAVVSAAAQVVAAYNCAPIETPILEQAALFERSLGDGSDVVQKEMFQLTSLGGERLAMRPEGTAAVMRALCQEHVQPQGRFWYHGPMFRYERPQSGRYRQVPPPAAMCRRRPSHSAQFNQLGVEFVGSDSVADDVEAIACAHSVLSSIGCTPPPRLLINSLGTPHDRARYRQHLAAHFAAHTCALSRDSVQRLQRGAVLRVLDSKDAADAAAISSAPCMSASLSRDSELRLQAVLHGLRLLRVPFTVDRRLVRGLDYYTSTAFEFVVGDGRACNAVLAGGRYDLGPQLQRASVPAIGWALGVDRFLALFPPSPAPPPRTVTVIAGPGSSAAAAAQSSAAAAAQSSAGADSAWPAERQAALLLCARLRQQGIPTVLDCDGSNLKKAMSRASKYAPPQLRARSRRSRHAAQARQRGVRNSRRRRAQARPGRRPLHAGAAQCRARAAAAAS